MSEIRFSRYSRGFEMSYLIAHIACGVVTLIMSALAIFKEHGFIYLPPIFFMAAIICVFDALDLLRNARGNKTRVRRGYMWIGLAVIMIAITVISALCFWR